MAKHRFMEAYEAYDILADPWKRKIYDGRREVASDAAARSSNAEYDQWAKEARAKGEHYTEISYEEFWEDVHRNVRTILFGSEIPSAHEVFVIFGKMFLLVSIALGIVTAPFYLHSVKRAIPIFLIDHLRVSPATIKLMEAYYLAFAGLSALFLFLAAFVVSEFFEFTWREMGSRIFGFFFTIDDSLIPLVPCFAGVSLSLITWLVYFLAV